MRIPQVIFGSGLLVLLVLLSTPQHRAATYNPSSEITIVGTVQEVQSFYCPISGGEGTHLLVATANGVMQVHVAPTAFLQGKHWSFKQGDRVEVVGSRMRFMERDSIVARTVSLDDANLSFRRLDGKPLWMN